jgi:hypothetical protein
MELRQLLMQALYCGIRSILGHLLALRRTFQMESALIIGAHRLSPCAQRAAIINHCLSALPARYPHTRQSLQLSRRMRFAESN